MVEMARVESLFRVNSVKALKYLNTFVSMNPDSSGRVTLHEFLRVLRLKPSTLSKEASFGYAFIIIYLQESLLIQLILLVNSQVHQCGENWINHFQTVLACLDLYFCVCKYEQLFVVVFHLPFMFFCVVLKTYFGICIGN